MIPVLFLEILAATAGIFYLKKTNATLHEKLFVVFLWFSVGIEILSSYAGFAYFSEYMVFGFVEETPFRNNYWLSNIYLLVNNLVYIYFFGVQLHNTKAKKLLVMLAIAMVIAVIIDFGTSDFFNTLSRVSTIFGSLLVLMTILFFYLELLVSEKLLALRYNLSFYISVVLLIYTLCISPLDYLINYFKTSTGNQLFVSLRVNTLFILNILLYLTYTFAFILCSKKKK
ncbi:hypothetical protein [Rasiella sp. SM2506]|uniref:hypothetical protein n=1 Tax=Rasiella sp. SM2506 TaxID=3423914 RepID=UPI003D78FD10